MTKFQLALLKHWKQNWLAVIIHSILISVSVILLATNFGSDLIAYFNNSQFTPSNNFNWLGWLLLTILAIIFYHLSLAIQDWKFDILSFSFPLLGIWLMQNLTTLDYQDALAKVSFLWLVNITITSASRQVLADKEGQMIRKMFGRYVNHQILDDLLLHSENRSANSATQKEMTVFFADIRGFTTLAEKLNPTDLIEILNRYLTGFSEVISRHDGTIDKFIGDAIMAFWNAPFTQNRHASLAVKAAMDMIDELEKLNQEVPNGPQLKLGIGVNTGEMVVGSVGSKTKLDYTVLGDQVNLGARLEGLCKKYQVPILISHSTMQQAKANNIIFRLVDNIVVKGRSKPVRIYQPLQNTTANKLLLKNYHKGFEHYRNGGFNQAIQTWTETATSGDILSQIMLARARDLIANPDDQWEGIWHWDEK